MADNELFFDALEELDGLLESPERNQNHTNDDNDDGHSNPETGDHEIQINSSLHLDRNFPTSSFSRETRVSSNLSTQFSSPEYRNSRGISASDSLAGAQHSISEAPEEGRMSPFLVPVVASTGEFSWTDEYQSNPSEHLSSQNYFDFSNWSPSAVFSPVESISNNGTTTDRVSIGSVEDSEAISVAVPSGIQTLLMSSGKEKTFECLVCGKIFSSKHTLRQHGRIHTGEKPFACNTCGKRFTQIFTLNQHRLIHSDEKPHDCPWPGCDKKFRHKSTVKSHIRTHTKEKPFTCGKCDKSFAHKGSLQAHLRTHTREKPFKCEFCDECFSTQGNRIRHQKRKHGGM